jgi:hypothetical protein
VLRGVLPANGAGPQDVLVQTARGCALAAGAVLLEPPRLVVAADRASVRLESRPGDRALVLVATAIAAEPQWSPFGARWPADEDVIATATIEHGVPLAAGSAGAAPLALPASGPCWLQALVLPAGEPDDSAAARWSALTHLP